MGRCKHSIIFHKPVNTPSKTKRGVDMLNKFKRIMILEKIPGAVCAAACVASVLMGFSIGYMVFSTGEPVLAYGDAGPPSASYISAVTPELPGVETPETTPPPPPEAGHMFVVTVLDGYIVIYHSQENGGGLKEVTSTIVDALAPEEQEQLKNGIKIYSEEDLARILQDYGS